VVEEVKWKKPSRPEGALVWSHDGILCVADTLKNAVRLTFPKGAQMNDPKKLFNTRLDSSTVRAIDFHEGACHAPRRWGLPYSSTVRAIDFHEGDTVDEATLRALIVEALGLKTAKKR
jgi:hypothetical protein